MLFRGVQGLLKDFFTVRNGYRKDKNVQHHVVYFTATKYVLFSQRSSSL